jgi:hypothetical protein
MLGSAFMVLILGFDPMDARGHVVSFECSVSFGSDAQLL